MAPEVPAPSASTTPAGKYQVLKRLAVGGMAEIYLARVTGIQGFEKHVVLKKIRPVHARDQRFVDMFLDEARLAAQLQHHNIAQVYDIGELDGGYFFSMEFLHGQDVQRLLKTLAAKKERLALEHALTIVAGAAAGLHYAHERKSTSGRPLHIVHRDVSPSNILLTYDGAVKVVDFGIARAAKRESTDTRSGTLKGKIAYMSPEQCRGEELDRRSDIFSLGIVLYEAATTSRLFRSGKEADFLIMQRIVEGKVPPPRTLVPDFPPELERVLMRALAVDRSQRYQTAREMLMDLENVAALLRLPLSTARLSGCLEATFGSPQEPWYTQDEPASAAVVATDVEVEVEAEVEVDRTVSTTGAPAGEARVLEELTSILGEDVGDQTWLHDAPAGDAEGKTTVHTGSSPHAPSMRAPGVPVVAQSSNPSIRQKPNRTWLWLLGAAGLGIAAAAFLATRGGSSDTANTRSKSASPIEDERPLAQPALVATPDAGPTNRALPAGAGTRAPESSRTPAPVTARPSQKIATEPKTPRRTKTKPKRRRRPSTRATKAKPGKAKSKDGLIDTNW